MPTVRLRPQASSVLEQPHLPSLKFLGQSLTRATSTLMEDRMTTKTNRTLLPAAAFAALCLAMLTFDAGTASAGCADRIAETCRDRERSCNATGRAARGECRWLYLVCLRSVRCLQGSGSGPSVFGPDIDRKGTLVPECQRWVFRWTGREPCNPATQDCVCMSRTNRVIRVEPPRCTLWGHRYTRETPCIPGKQDCICLRSDTPPGTVEVRPPS